MILSWVVIVGLVWTALRAFMAQDDRRDPPRDAKDLLAERFANGEIDAEDYHDRLRVLDESRRSTADR